MTRLSDRKFGLMFTAVFLILAGIGYFVSGEIWLWALSAAGAFAIVSLAMPWLLLPLNRIWIWFGNHFSHINNLFILALFYFVVLLPFSLVMRLIGRDPMHRKIGPDVPDYWTPVTRAADGDTFNDMF